MHCGRRTFTMVHTVSLLLLVVAAASAAAELNQSFNICETYSNGNQHGESIELPSYTVPPEQFSMTISVPQILSSGCMASSTKVEVCHARSEPVQTTLNSGTLEVQRSRYPIHFFYSITITITTYCDGVKPGPKVLPKLD